jgi:hypothetical protein
MMKIPGDLLAVVYLVSLAIPLSAQAPETYKGRLAPVPVDAQLLPNTAGHGSASVALAGAKLTLSGTFEGLRAPATAAQLRRGLATGVRGPVLYELTVSKAATGTISGSFDLTPEQIDGLRKGRLYVQIDSEKAPDGNLWGWLLK